MIGVPNGLGAVLAGERRLDNRDRRLGPKQTVLPLMSVAPDRPACVGMGEVFDSTEPQVMEQARRVCDRCPVQQWCAREARHAVDARLPIAGTWAGVAYSGGTALGTGVADD